MNKVGQRLGGLLLIAGLCAAGWVYRYEQAQQTSLLREISLVDENLRVDNQQAARKAKGLVRYLANQVCRNYNQARDIDVLNQSRQVLFRTQTLADTLRALRGQLQAGSSTISTPELVRHLDHYSEFIRAYAPSAFHLTRQFPGAPDPGWLNRFYVEQVPPEATWATLTKLEALIRRNEADALSFLAQKIGTRCMFFTRINAQAVPASETVAAGGEYQARLFLTEAIPLNRSTMQLTANGRSVPMDAEDAVGHVAFSIPPAAPGQPDTVRASWHGTVRAQVCPADTFFTVDVLYFIVKPKH